MQRAFSSWLGPHRLILDRLKTFLLGVLGARIGEIGLLYWEL